MNTMHNYNKFCVTGGFLLSILLLAAIMVAVFGCGINRGDFQINPVAKDNIAQYSGWNFGPGNYILAGQPVIVDGVLVRIKGLDFRDYLRVAK